MARMARVLRRIASKEVKYYGIAIMESLGGSPQTYGAQLVYHITNTLCNEYGTVASTSMTDAVPLFQGFGQGVTKNTRIGDKIFCKGIGIRLSVNRYSADTTNNSDNPLSLRVSLVGIPKDDVQSAAPQFLDVFSEVAPPNLTVRHYDRTSLRVFWDKVYTMTPTVAKTGDGNLDARVVNIRKYIKINKTIICENSNPTLYNPKDGKYNFYLFCYAYAPGCPNTTTAGNLNIAPIGRAYGVVRMYFTDC